MHCGDADTDAWRTCSTGSKCNSIHNLKISATLRCSWALLSAAGKSDLEDVKISGDMCTASRLDQGKTEDLRVQQQRQPAVAFEMPVAAPQLQALPQ